MSDAHTDDAHGHAEEPSYINARKGLMSWIVTLDHKRIGILYLLSTMFFFAIAGFSAVAVRLELFTPAGDMMSGDAYNKMFTLHGGIMVFLVIIPLTPAALGNFLLPLMLGAKDVAFPRLNLASYYIYVAGAMLLVSAVLLGGFDTGWTFYTPYSSSAGGPVTWALLGAFTLGFSSIFTGLNFVVTIHKMRAPGLTMWKMPLMIWALYATSITQLLATPVLAITLLLLVMERVLGIGIFDPAMGGDPVLMQHFFWFYSHPAVYIMILPAFGIISELVAVHSRKRIFGYGAIALSSVSIAVIGFLVWGHHMFVSGQSTLSGAVFSFLTFFVAVPTAIKTFGWVATMYKGSIRFTTPMLYTLSFLFLFTIGGLTGLFLSTMATDVHLHDTYFVVAHFHYVMASGAVISFLGGLHHWWPKIFGTMYDEAKGRIGAVIIFAGFNLTFFPQFVMGSQGMPRRYHSYVPEYALWHQLSTIGSLVLAFGLFYVAWYLLKALKGPKAPDNPWGGVTLEWATATPPIEHNFHETPVVTHGPYDFPEIDESLGGGHH
jgi:cytochrome c oxidase subunit 1